MTAPKPHTRPLLARLWRHVADQWIVHLTLLVMAALFVFPFIWMIGMSLKTDDEATSTAMFPAVPTFRAASPFVVPPENLPRPETVDRARWENLLPQLTAAAKAAIAPLPLPPGVEPDIADLLRDAATVEAVRRGIGRLDDRRWADSGGDAQMLADFKSTLTPDELQILLGDRLARFELTGIQIRSLSGHVNQITRPGQPDGWKVVSGNADLVPSGGSALMVRYRFDSASAEPVVLRYDFAAGVAPAELHRLIISYTGDASWHRMDVQFRLDDKTYTSNSSTYIAQSRASGLLLQPPTFQDDTLGPRSWVPLTPMDSTAIGGDNMASLTLTLTPSSTVRAVYGKVERNYARAFRSVPFWTYVRNSVILVVLQLAGAMFSSGFVAYAFARLNWPGRSLALGVLLATMMLPAQVTMIPTFLIWRSLGWYNTLNPLWIGAWLGNAFFIFLMIQHMKTIPRELDEAAKIDGMNPLQTWWYVIMPQVKPTLAAIAIMTFMGAWNEFMGPLIMLRDQSKFPLSLGLFSMRLDSGDDWSLIMAGNLLMTLPVIVIFFLFQRYFVEGVAVTGMKG